MKRGEALVRRTPLRTVARIRQQSTKRAAQAVQFKQVRAAAQAREGGDCAAHIDSDCAGLGCDPQHRLPQGRGGRDDLWNVVWVCRSCHRWITENPRAAAMGGWNILGRLDPAVVPVLRWHHGRRAWSQPTPDGWVPASPHPEQVRLLDLNRESA